MHQDHTPNLAETSKPVVIDSELRAGADLHNSIVWTDHERMGGNPCFAGTRVPIQTLWDHLENGDSLDVFLNDFEGVTREQAVAVLHLALERLLNGLPQP